MAGLAGSQSEENLKKAFAGESQANRRYLYFARRADIEGYPEVCGLFRDISEAETGHAFGHLDFLKETGAPTTGEAVGDTEANLKAAVAGEKYEYAERSPARSTNTPRCILCSLARRARRASKSWPSGSRRWRVPSVRTRAGSLRGRSTSAARLLDQRLAHRRVQLVERHVSLKPMGDACVSAQDEDPGFVLVARDLIDAPFGQVG